MMHSLVFQMFSGPPFGAHGVAEHSSVMSMVLVSSYIKESGAWLAFLRKTRTGTSKSRPTFAKTVRQTILQAVRPLPGRIL